jgi:hypothetical protein
VRDDATKRKPTVIREQNEINIHEISFQRSSHPTRYSRITHELKVGLVDQDGGGKGLWSFLGGLHRRLISEPSTFRHTITYITHRSVILLRTKPSDQDRRALSPLETFIACYAHFDRIRSNHRVTLVSNLAYTPSTI